MPTKGRLFAGCTVALVTPFRDGAVDEAALRRSVEWHISQGTPVLSPVGTTGESPTLTHDEHERVIAIVVETAAGRAKVMAGTGSNSTAEAIRLDPFRRAGRSRRVAPGGALLQSPQPGRPVPSFCRDRRVYGFAAGSLQRAGSDRSQHRARDRRAARRDRPDRRRQRSRRLARPGQRIDHAHQADHPLGRRQLDSAHARRRGRRRRLGHRQPCASRRHRHDRGVPERAARGSSRSSMPGSSPSVATCWPGPQPDTRQDGALASWAEATAKCASRSARSTSGLESC